MDFVLTYKNAKLVKDAAHCLDVILDIDYDIESLRRSGFADTEKCLKKAFRERKKYARKFWANLNKLNKYYGIRKNPFFSFQALQKFLHVNNVIYTQFTNSSYLYDDDYDETTDGPIHPSLDIVQLAQGGLPIEELLDGYQAHFMPTREMIGMKF